MFEFPCGMRTDSYLIFKKTSDELMIWKMSIKEPLYSKRETIFIIGMLHGLLLRRKKVHENTTRLHQAVIIESREQICLFYWVNKEKFAA